MTDIGFATATAVERPILFSDPMVRALLAGTKTQTRRVVKVQPNPAIVAAAAFVDRFWCWISGHDGSITGKILSDGRCPYGQPGDRLYVREAFRFLDSFDGDSPSAVGDRCLAAGYPKPWAPTQYEADGWRDNWMQVGTPRSSPGSATAGKLRPGIHMPRWASRILLEIVEVRVERLQDISEADCAKEGAPFSYSGFAPEDAPDWRGWYRGLWESINGPGSWDANPWVWVVEFRRI